MNAATLLERFRRRDRLALSRLLTLVSRGEALAEVRELLAAAPPGRVVAVTGSGGVGKSTLIGALVGYLRGQGVTVAVLACDPESPLTGGALLGDRLRMPSPADDLGLYIRSVATPSGREAVASHLDVMVQLLTAYGFGVVLLETVGAGQGDTAVRQLADALVVVVQPESGDDVQFEKAGLLEVADVVVVNKADLPGADRTEATVRGLLNLPGCRPVPVLKVSAARGQGLEALWRTLEELPSRRDAGTTNERALLRQAQQLLAERFHLRPGAAREVVDRWGRGLVAGPAAAEALIRALIEEPIE